MSKQLSVSVRHNHTLIALFEDEKLGDIVLDRPDQESAVGNIYVGRVSRVLANIQAAFINIGLNKDGFLPGVDGFSGPRPRGNAKPKPLEDRLKVGQLVPVRIEKDEIADKGKKLHMDLSLAGRFLVYLPYHSKLNISKRIEDEKERDRLKEVLESTKGAEKGGWIIRTATEGVTKKELQRDARDLLAKWKTTTAQIARATDVGLVYRELTPVEQVLRDNYSEDFNRVLVDNVKVRQDIEKYIRSITRKRFIPRRVTEYVEPDKLMKTFNFEKELQRSLQRKVWLDCGGYIIIEETETLNAIDVNTGKHKGGESGQSAILQTNMEAAEEIARQLRLRGLGGIIVIDFIDMPRKKDQQKVENALRRAMSKGRVAFDITTFSDIGLVQITRKRTGESLVNLLSEECSHCEGNGRILHIR